MVIYEYSAGQGPFFVVVYKSNFVQATKRFFFSKSWLIIYAQERRKRLAACPNYYKLVGGDDGDVKQDGNAHIIRAVNELSRSILSIIIFFSPNILDTFNLISYMNWAQTPN